MIYGISDAKASMLVQIIHSFIIDECTGTCRKISDELKNRIGTMNKKLLRKNMLVFVDDNIINEYKKMIQRLPIQVCEMIAGYLDKDFCNTNMPLFGEEVFHYQLSYDLINEYNRTDGISSTVEELVDKSLDLVLLKGIGSKSVCEVMQLAKPGKVLLDCIGLGSDSHIDRRSEEIFNMLTGVSKNIYLRIQGIMLRHFTNLVYETYAKHDEDAGLRLIS